MLFANGVGSIAAPYADATVQMILPVLPFIPLHRSGARRAGWLHRFAKKPVIAAAAYIAATTISMMMEERKLAVAR
jgi:hypothetical protein